MNAGTAGLDALVARVVEAHHRPPLLAALLELDRADRFAPQQLAMLLARDPMLGERVYLSQATVNPDQRPAITIRDAIDRSGFEGIHNCAIAVGIAHSFRATPAPGQAPAWSHAFAVATAGSLLGEALFRRHADTFLAGLLGACGRLLLHMHEPAALATARAVASRDGADLRDAQRGLLGFTDRDVARGVAEVWELPPTVLAAFEAPPPGEEPSMATLVRRAEAAAIRHGFPDPHDVPDREPAAEQDPHFEGILRKLGGERFLRQASVGGLMSAAGIVE